MQHLRTLASLVFTAVVLFSALLLSPRSAAVAAGSADIVISQLYAGGGRSVLENSLYQNDYVELFNRGASSVDVSTWSLQYQATTQSPWSATNLSGVIRPGGRLLVAGELATPKPFPLPVAVSGADVSGSLQANPGRGKLALVTSRTLLTCGAGINDCIGNPLIRDFLGYGTVGGGQDGPNNFEALPAIAFKLNQALLRLGEGCTDTDNNRSDFVVSPPRPRNSSTAFHSCPQATATPTASPTATQTPVGGAPRTPVGASTPTLGPSPTSSPLPSPTPVVQRYAIVLDAVPDAGSGPFAVTGGVYGVGSVSASGIASDGAAAVGRYLAFGWRYGSGFGETAGTQVLSLPSGDLSVSGAVPLVIPVTGGTGAFAGARGEVRVSPLGSDGRSFSVQLSVVGSSGSRSLALPTSSAPASVTPTATLVGTALTPTPTPTPTPAPSDPRYVLQMSRFSDGWVEGGALFATGDLQDDGSIRSGATSVGSFRSWVLPETGGALSRMASIQIGSQGELLVSGFAPGGMPIVGGSGRYRDARGTVLLEARGETSLVTILLRAGTEPPRLSPTATPMATTEAPSDS